MFLRIRRHYGKIDHKQPEAISSPALSKSRKSSLIHLLQLSSRIMASDDGSPTGRTKIGSRLSSILQELHERQSIQSPKSPVAPAPIKLTADDEIVIGIMGATGVGKSSFIRLVTGDDQVQVGRGLKSSKGYD
jgi:ABC-type transport system involved in cytochrome bd biosynthesis fused ATPase/permease subunit